MRIVSVVLLNAILAALVQVGAPSEPALSDRVKYEEYAEHISQPEWFTRSGPWSGLIGLNDRIYPYRILVPAALATIPLEPSLRWKLYRWIAVSTAGSIVAITALSRGNSSIASAVLATVMAQGSFGFAFTAYDPYGPDPFVFVCLALMTWCWLRDRWLIALAIGVIGIFAKETVVLGGVAITLASMIRPRRPSWAMWLAQGPALAGLLLLYRWAYDEYVGWGHVAPWVQVWGDREGRWLSLWMSGNPLSTQFLLVFSVFATSWVFAIVSFRHALQDLRALAIGAAAPFLALVVIQNPERALGNLFFVVIPLALIALERMPQWIAFTSVALNAMLSVRVATMNAVLPGAKYTAALAIVVGAFVLWKYSSEITASNDNTSSLSRVTSR